MSEAKFSNILSAGIIADPSVYNLSTASIVNQFNYDASKLSSNDNFAGIDEYLRANPNAEYNGVLSFSNISVHAVKNPDFDPETAGSQPYTFTSGEKTFYADYNFSTFEIRDETLISLGNRGLSNSSYPDVGGDVCVDLQYLEATEEIKGYMVSYCIRDWPAQSESTPYMIQCANASVGWDYPAIYSFTEEIAGSLDDLWETHDTLDFLVPIVKIRLNNLGNITKLNANKIQLDEDTIISDNGILKTNVSVEYNSGLLSIGGV